MAKVEITLKCSECGKEFVHTNYKQSRKLADSYEEWAKDNITVCPECYKKAIREEKETRINRAFEEVKNLVTSELIGTEKQVKWAEQIRKETAGNFAEAVKENRIKPEFWDKFNSIISSVWWIEHRDTLELTVGSAYTLIKRYNPDKEDSPED
jgi:DNA-directed RNA polymerase subunit RPC12/RpoP